MKGSTTAQAQRASARPLEQEAAHERGPSSLLPDLQQALGNRATVGLLDSGLLGMPSGSDVLQPNQAAGGQVREALTSHVDLPSTTQPGSPSRARRKSPGGAPDKGVEAFVENVGVPAAPVAPAPNAEGAATETETAAAETETPAEANLNEEPASSPTSTNLAAAQAEDDEEGTVQAKPQSGARSTGSAPPRLAGSSLGAGTALAGATRTRMERGLGRSFSGVRVHTGSRARNLSTRFGARAFTVGQHVAFGAGEYRPGTVEGDALLAHELAHTAQQAASVSEQQAQTPLQVGGGDYHALERDADEAAAHATAALWSSTAGSRLQPRGPQRKSGLRLSRCSSGTTIKTSARVGSHTTACFHLNKLSPKRSNSASSSVDLKGQSYKAKVIDDQPNNQWKYALDTVDSKGDMQIVYYTDDHYPAPTPTDDSGALTNVTRSNWQTIVTDLESNKTGMAGSWSAYRAEDVHEHFHWEKEWQVDAKRELAKAETEIDKLSVPKADAADADAAEKKLKPKATQEFKKAIKAAKTAYGARGDDPGDPPYVAQAPAIQALADRIKAHAASKGW